jgi:hypothetical protein
MSRTRNISRYLPKRERDVECQSLTLKIKREPHLAKCINTGLCTRSKTHLVSFFTILSLNALFSSALNDITSAMSQQQQRKVFVANADTFEGYAIARECLTGKLRDRFDEVLCGVHKVSRSGDLIFHGGHLIQLGNDASQGDIERHLRGVDTLLLVPNPGASDMVGNASEYLKACQHSGVKRCLLVSLIGCDDRQVRIADQYAKCEEQLKNSGIENYAVVRLGIIQNWMFLWSPQIKEQGRLCMPMKHDVQFAPLNVCDMAYFCSWVVSEGIRGKTEKFQLTGNELINAQVLVQRINKTVGSQHQIEYQQIEREHAKRWLQMLLANDRLVEKCLDICELANRGKFNMTSNDEKKSGKEPINLDQFLKDHLNQFKPRQGQMKK